MVACVCLDKAAVLTDISDGALRLLVCRGAEIYAGIGTVFPRVEIYAGNIYPAQDFLVRVSVVPCRVVESVAVSEIIIHNPVENFRRGLRKEEYFHFLTGVIFAVFPRVVRDAGH